MYFPRIFRKFLKFRAGSQGGPADPSPKGQSGFNQGHQATAIEALRELVTAYVPVVNGRPTSVGSIWCLKKCGFFETGRCADGLFCRFSHNPA